MPRNQQAALSRVPSTDGQRVIAFIHEYCRCPEGALVGQPMVLDEFQQRFILDIYDNPAITRRAYLSIARKNGKTALIASLVLAHLVGPVAIQNSQIVSGAMSRDQAGLVFSLASKMIMLSDELRSIIRIVPSTKRLIGLPMNVEYRALAADGKTAHGLSPVLAILDEIGQIRGATDAFVDAITTSQGAHERPLLIAISTQSASDQDMFSLWLDDAEKSKDPRIVSHVYKADESADVMDEAAWKAANPALNNFRSYDDIKEQAIQASRMPTAENTFRNLCLNQRVSTHSPFISKSVWIENGGNPEEIQPGSFVGLDLSQRTDLTAMVVCHQTDDIWHVNSYFWTPEQGLEERAKRDRAQGVYEKWVKQGYLRTTPGASVDYRYVIKEMTELLPKGVKIAFDRWRIDQFKQAMNDLGVEFDMTEFGQGYKDMSPAIDALEACLLNGKIRHGNHPVLTMCVNNSSVVKDPAGNRKLDKQRSTGRIDGAVALAMAIGLSEKHEKAEEPEYQVFLL